MKRLLILILLIASTALPAAAGAVAPQGQSRPSRATHHARKRACTRRHHSKRRRSCVTRHHRTRRSTKHRSATKKHKGKKKQTTQTGTTGTTGGAGTGTTKTKTTGATGTTPSGGGSGGATASDSPDPSGVPIPTANPAGWTEDFADDFTEPSLADDPQWTPYSGPPAGQADEGWWDPAHDVVSDGGLQIGGYRDASADALGAPGGAYVTGGVETTTFSQTYGKYLVRMRIDQGQGVAVSVLLWPIVDGSHDEIDFAEDNGADPRAWNTGTVHYGSGNTKIVSALEVDLTQWHTFGVEWSPGRVVYTIDGRAWATVTNSNVPALPMRIDLQTQSWACGADPWEQCIGADTPPAVNLDVDWVVAYRAS